MKESPEGHWHNHFHHESKLHFSSRNEEKPEWALTHDCQESGDISHRYCGNEEKPEWALTHVSVRKYFCFRNCCGNEEKPEWALTHLHLVRFLLLLLPVEMKRSPNGHWHTLKPDSNPTWWNVEMKRSPNGHWHNIHTGKKCFTEDRGNEEKPEWALTPEDPPS